MRNLLIAAAIALATPVYADGLTPFQFNQMQMDQAQANIIQQEQAGEQYEMQRQQLDMQRQQLKEMQRSNCIAAGGSFC
jgi:hypothetical protein